MKTLLLYASKYGCTEDCVTYLKNKLNHESKMVNLKDLRMVDLQQYDWIIIGGSIYIENIRKEVKLFCKQNLQILLKKTLCYLCAAQHQSGQTIFLKAISQLSCLNILRRL